jgi:xanthine dehydrogenase accessory factor
MDAPVIAPLPHRVSMRGDDAPDDAIAAFTLLRDGLEAGLRGALLTLVETNAGSARAVGAQMAVLEDGSFTGYLSSGCLEAALAAEAVVLLRQQKNAVLRFGTGSPFLDIRLPCGGSMDVLVDTTMDGPLVHDALDHFHARRAFSLGMGTERRASVAERPHRTGWHDDSFYRRYTPALQLVVLGRGLEFEAVVRLATAAGYPVQAWCADDGGMDRLHGVGRTVSRLTTPGRPPRLELDEHTAVLLLFHDHDWETGLLGQALRSPCCYIGAMGSARTHELRCRRLIDAGYDLEEVDRIRGPIGLFGPTRDASSLAISVMAEIAQLRATLDP